MTEAIFWLSTIINLFLFNKKRLYCCFLDFKKTFDTVNRAKLWRKLNAVGISSKLICIIRSMYKKIKTCVQSEGMLSEFFMSNVGLLQGEVLSPMLFSLYVNDFESKVLKNGTVIVFMLTWSQFFCNDVCWWYVYFLWECWWTSKNVRHVHFVRLFYWMEYYCQRWEKL